MASKTPSSGRFVWHELATNDVKQAVAFYSELFGWTSKEEDMGPGGKYVMLKSGDTGVGGMMSLMPGEKAPPHWRAYCTVPDVDAAARRAQELGGTIQVPPTDIPNVGRFAAIADPQGAVLMAFRDLNEAPEPQGPPAPGTFCWDELVTPDPAAAVKFYTPIYGWTVVEQPMGSMGTYHVLKRGDVMSGGIMKTPGPGVPTYWAAYVAVKDVDATMKRAEKLKAKLVVPPSDIPGMGRFAVFSDPSGAVLSIFQGRL
ncbi:MAG TPA: VOC family protein [Polyangiaceae bacterium]|nr:VOC family protein [Polyangiaceae bacterium]